jgi:hypothetical protein
MCRDARFIVMTCHQGYQMGDRSFAPLQEGIEARLKTFLSPQIWKQAKDYTRFYLRRQQRIRDQMIRTPALPLKRSAHV